MLWSKAELQNLFGIDAEANGVSFDTRSLQPGDLFFGLLGENGIDGMEFAGVAREKGAAAIIDGLENLQRLAVAARDRSSAKRIAVTGSVGKTTTKELLAHAFSALGKTHAAPASFNNHIGVPLTLSRMPKNSEFAIFEIGMNHRGEIAPLTQMVRPDIAIITAIAPVHLEHLGSMQAIADEKADVFSGLAEDGVAIIPADSEFAAYLKAKAGNRRVLTFGQAENADFRLMSASLEADRIAFKAQIGGRVYDAVLPQMGLHIAVNAMAALGAVHVAGGDVEVAAARLVSYAPMAGRGARFNHNGITVLDESYNASPVSVAATLKTLASTASQGRRVAILGDMFELGPEGPELHRLLADVAAALPIDQVVTCGALMKNLHDALPEIQKGPHFDDSSAVAAEMSNLLKDQDCVLIKGSLGMKMKTVVEAIRQL